MMNNLTYQNVHNRFKWDGLHLNRENLCGVGASLIKEGDDFEKETGKFLLDWFDEKLYIELTTSGTTGPKKSIRVMKQAMVNSALATGDFFGLKIGDKALHCLPTKYIAGKMMLVRGLILGLEMDFGTPSSKPLINNKKKYDFVAMVPLQVQNSINELGNFKKVIIGGAKIGESLKKKLLKVPSEIYETYGMTETVSHIAAKKIGESSFSVMPKVKVTQDERQCLVIHAPRITEEKMITNDLVDLVSDTQFIFKGRIDNIVNSGGIKICPEEIENKLSEKIISRFFLAGIPDEDLGEKLIFVLESEKQDFDETIFDILDKFEKPKEIHFISKFKETESGKIMRRETINSIPHKA